MYPKRRATNPEVQQKRHALQLLRPFLSELDRWNTGVPKYLAVLASGYTSVLSKAEAFASLKDVLDELDQAELSFAELTQSIGGHSRVEDVRLSMQRLRGRIAPVVALLGPGEAPAVPFPLPQPETEAASAA
jgi:hypothetical protein